MKFYKKTAALMLIIGFCMVFVAGGISSLWAEEAHGGSEGEGNVHVSKEPPVRSYEKEPESPIPEFITPPPPFTEGIYPCSTCHVGIPVNKERRELGYHGEIKLVHAQKQRWCLDCHNSENRDMLHLANGDLVPFDKLYLLCGQCHGPIFRDWKAGVHGKRTGYWNGKKEYRLCTHCHDPHSPRFKPVKPLPMPARPLDVDNIEKTEAIEVEGKTLHIPVYKATEKDNNNNKHKEH